MCGDLDDDDAIGAQLGERFRVMARMLGPAPAPAAPKLDSAEGRAAYMESLFHAGLTRSLNDVGALPPGETVDAIASQAIAFARLAGFIAGQLPPEADLYRSVIDAISEGHAETGRLARRYRAEQAEAHGHSHDHDHDGHEHDHEHGAHHHHHH